MQFVPYNLTATIPNIIVDGSGNDHTVLTLSHWPKSGSPLELRGDTSTAIVFNYLDAPQLHIEAEAVSNNHFDEDGLVGIFALLQPVVAQRHRDLLVDVAEAGDFGVFERRHAARIAFVLSAYADPESSPLPTGLFNRPYADLASELYVQLLDVLPRLIMGVEDYRRLWESEDAKLTATEELINRGLITVEEQTELDLAIIRLPEELTPQRVHRFTQRRLAECHPFALHNRTTCSRLLLLQGRRAELQYRYESWVQFASRRPAPRVDLSELASELNLEETTGGRWVFDGVDQITPKLHLEGSGETSVPIDTIVKRVEHHLRAGRSAWDPYD
jgi:hypothetical protein